MEESVLLQNYTYHFSFENNFNKTRSKQWMTDNWDMSVYIAIAYVITIFGIKSFMSSQPPFKLRGPLILWNALFATFSLAGAVRLVPGLIFLLENFGFNYSVCNSSLIELNKVTGFWLWAFILSKVFELGDTLFIVLRKQKLIFLHWCHHVTTLVYCWYSYPAHAAFSIWFGSMNYSVHAIMYAYFALRAAKVNVPRWIAVLITASQILQMIVGTYVSLHAYRTLQKGEFCVNSEELAQLSLVMYFYYFALFAHLFYKSYFPSRTAKKYN